MPLFPLKFSKYVGSNQRFIFGFGTLNQLTIYNCLITLNEVPLRIHEKLAPIIFFYRI